MTKRADPFWPSTNAPGVLRDRLLTTNVVYRSKQQIRLRSLMCVDKWAGPLKINWSEHAKDPDWFWDLLEGSRTIFFYSFLGFYVFFFFSIHKFEKVFAFKDMFGIKKTVFTFFSKNVRVSKNSSEFRNCWHFLKMFGISKPFYNFK